MTTSLDSNGKPRGLVVFDLDGTLLCERTICELLAEPLGRAAEMHRFERLSSEADIARSRVEMATWYRGLTTHEVCAPLENATWRAGVGEAVRLLRANAIDVAIASITWSFAVRWVADRIGVSRVLGTDLAQDGSIQHVWPRDKGSYVRALSEELAIPQERIAAVGDSANDQHLLQEASLRFFVGHGVPPSIPELRVRSAGNILEIAQEVVDAWVRSA